MSVAALKTSGKARGGMLGIINPCTGEASESSMALEFLAFDSIKILKYDVHFHVANSSTRSAVHTVAKQAF